MYERQVFERHLTEAEEKQLFATIKQFKADVYARRDLAMLTLLRQAGIRVGSCAGLTCADARAALRSHKLALRPEICKQSGRRAAAGKPARGYSAYLNKRARAALKELLACRRDMGHTEHPDGALVMSRHGNGISVRSIQQRMRKWCLAAGLDVAASPHWLRHTCAKRIVQRSTSRNPVAIVQRQLGQASPASAAVYTMPDREEIEDAVEAAG